MKLNVPERVTLLNSLPQHGNLVNIKIVRRLKEDVSFDEEEQVEVGMETVNHEEGGQTVRWNPDCTMREKDIEIGEKAMDIIVKALTNLDNSGRLTESHIAICEKFLNQD